jgi:Ni/Co efflux regulator RcnB
MILASLCAILPVAAQAQDHGGGPQGSPPPGSSGDHPSGGDQGGGGYPHGGDPSHGGDPHGGGRGHGGYPPHGGYGRGWGYRGGAHVTVIDRGRPGWWRGNPAFVGYAGIRPGYYYAPGYGYYAVPRAYARTAWVVGATLPLPMRRYAVVEPAAYGLRPPPFGYGWYYAGTNFVLVAGGSGVIVQSVAGGW